MNNNIEYPECPDCEGNGSVYTQGHVLYCSACDGAGHLLEHVACGWAFDAGMREAERDRAYGMTRAAFAAADGEFADSDARVASAVAAERERCAAWKRRLFFGCGCCISTAQSARNNEALDAIESGAPAPREG